MITADHIFCNLRASSKKQVFQAIAHEIAPTFKMKEEDLVTALLERERIGSTGIGCGVAIPHIKIEGAKRMYAILARLDQPIDFDAIDERPVDIIFMLIAPADSKTTQHLKMLAMISRFLKDENTCLSIRNAGEREKIITLLSDWVKSQAA